MFTGIIESLGNISDIRPAGTGRKITIQAGLDLSGTKIGDSIAIDGACLTVVEISGKKFTVDVSPETLSRSTLANARAGRRINIERALRLSDRLDGHLVSGHIDGTAKILYRRDLGGTLVFGFEVAEELSRYMIPKGSVAVDGISLTINTCSARGFEIAIIPHTAENTTIGLKNPGDWVNIETDLIGKYVEKFIKGENTEDSRQGGIDMDFLGKTGFL
ncbi:MAG: riboflavin synthase [Desulfobacteraceae bacterium]|nr:riboflavin synthase [Desulfobacteraceae bacterium]MCF8095772.1 riboflavin synthase [Desulfobacteraceae bacterium]